MRVANGEIYDVCCQMIRILSTCLLVYLYTYIMTHRKEILDLFSGKKIDTQPAFSGLIHVTAEGLQSEGTRLS